METKECCANCRRGCRHGNGESFCVYRGKWQLSDFRCAGYKPNLKKCWERMLSFWYRK